MQISKNDILMNSQRSNHLELKVALLIKSFANKPLLLDKLILNEAQGLLLELNIDNRSSKINTQNSTLNLQLPLKTTNIVDSLIHHGKSTKEISTEVAPTKLRLSITPQKQVRLSIYQEKTHPPLRTVPNDKQNASEQTVKALLFETAKITKNGSLKLDFPSVLFQKKPLVSAKSSQTATAITATTENKGSSKIHEPQNLKITVDQKVTVSSVAKELLTNHFSKQLPLSQSIKQLIKLNQTLVETKHSSPELHKLTSQIKQLISNIQKPVLFTKDVIKQKIHDSGHLTERNIAKQIKNKSPINQNDLKLNLLKTKTALEAIIVKMTESTNTNFLKETTNAPINLKHPNLLTNQQASASASSSSSFSPQAILNSSQAIKTSTSTATNHLTTETNVPTKDLSVDINLLTNQKKMATVIQNKNLQINQQNFIFKQTSEMLKEVKNTITQIESNQVLSLKNEQINLQQFLVDLPMGSGSKIDSFELLFEENSKDKHTRKKTWKVIVRFDLEPLGPMFAQVELQNERISTHIFSESQQTAQLINEHMHILKKSLFSAGVDVEELKSTQGNVPQKLIINDDHVVDTHI